MWVAMTWKRATQKTAPDCSLSFTLYLSQGQTRVGRLSCLRWNCIMGELPGKSKPCAWGQRCLPLLMLKCYCTIYKANLFCPHNGALVFHHVWGLAQRTLLWLQPLNLSVAVFHLQGYVCSCFLGRNLLRFELITGSYLYLFTVALVSRGHYSPHFAILVLSTGRPIISGKHYSKPRNTSSFPQCYLYR